MFPQTHFLSRHHSVHSATLGKGNSDDTLIKIKNGDMDHKGEVAMVFGKQVSSPPRAKRICTRMMLLTYVRCDAGHACPERRKGSRTKDA
jgi:hypothetical protein